MNLTLSGYSTALFSTWYFIDELGILFDAGDGLSAALLQKSRKINHVFITHADRDHLAGLHQFNQLNTRKGFPVIHYPADCGSFIAMEQFAKKFDPHVAGSVWKPVPAGEMIKVRDDIEVETIRNGHVPAAPGVVKSLSYKIQLVKTKLRKEFLALPQAELKALIAEKGKAFVSETVRQTLLGYSGDTPVEDDNRWDQCRVLIHESTFLGGAAAPPVNTHGNKHSTLQEVMQMVSGISIEALVLGHFSPRYSPPEIDAAIQKLYTHYNLKIPVFRLLPGQTVFDILKGNPVCG